MQLDLTKGNITKKILLFAFPMIIGNLLQQLYNIADTLIVGKFIGTNALAAVGSAYTLMVFIASILLGLCMGSGAVFSIRYGEKNEEKLKESLFVSFSLILLITIILNILVFIFIDQILYFLNIPENIFMIMKSYTFIIFFGITATFLYNYYACVLRAVGNSIIPLVFLGISAIINIILDLFFVITLNMGVEGAAIATVFSQYISGLGITIYTLFKFPDFRFKKKYMKWNKNILNEIFKFSFLTCIQQSIMNFGILMVQGLVNSFGATIMAAFAAAVKIDSFAYMPVQDFGNAFSTFIAQNYGAKETERIKKGIKSAIALSSIFCLIISFIVFVFAKQLMMIFVNANETAIINAGIEYLRIEGAFYIGIGCLFLLYGIYRAIEKPLMSVILTIISLGSRVFLAYTLSSISFIGVKGIWMSVPIGWALADITGILYYLKNKNKIEKKLLSK
ncbi:MATE family efflux transporter [Anaerofustis butyriciformans]|uniref:MATE family efflux transporter n=1 Tax=Anaerofustis butyriciformans TaxID=3108533 RepID=UPI002E2FDA8B|nr:MATE family efflux transporter [Anaerofustis sp. HA2171]